MTLLDDVRLGAQQPTWAKLPPDRFSSSGQEAIELAATAGLVLDDWQCWWMDNALAERRDGNWCAAENVLITGRQSGKNGCLAALELFYLFLMDDPLVVHSAHELPTAINHFHFMLGLIDASPDLSKKCKRPTFTNGAEAINLRSGATLRFRARGKNSGRGLTAARLIFDEAFKISPDAMGALIPTLRAMRNTQRTYASSAPKSDSMVLHSLIRRGRADDPQDRLFYAEWGNPIGTALDDEDAWAHANPALGVIRSNGTGVTIDALRDEYRTLVVSGDEELMAEFAREAVGIGEPPPSDTVAPPKLDQERWNDTAVTTHHDVTPGDCTLAYDVHQGWTTISIQTGSLASSWGAVVDHFKGTARLPERMAYFAAKYKPTAIGLDKGNGESFGELGAIVEHFEAEDLSTDAIKPVTPEAYKAACQAIVSAVEHGTAQRPKLAGIDQLQIAGEKATERIVGGGFVFDRKSPVPLSPLVSWLIARSLLPVKSDEREFFYY